MMDMAKILNSTITISTMFLQKEYLTLPTIVYPAVNGAIKINYRNGCVFRQKNIYTNWMVAEKENLDVSCFGDANFLDRNNMGGSFYCIDSANLKSALKKLIVTARICPSPVELPPLPSM